MKTDMASTSIDAYHAMGPRLGVQQRQIVAFLAKRCERDWTRCEISEATGLRLSSVCGRMKELTLLQVIQELPRRACRCTGRAAHPVRLAPAQLELEIAA